MSRADLEARFEDLAELAALTNSDTGTPDTAVEDDCIESAEAEIDSRIGMRYATPVVVSINASVASILKRKASDIAEYHAYSRGSIVPDIQIARYDAAVEWATRVGEGVFTLPGASTVPSTTGRAPRLQHSSGNREVASDDPRQWSRDTVGGL